MSLLRRRPQETSFRKVRLVSVGAIVPARASSATLIVQLPVTGWPLAKKKLIEYFWKCLVSAEFCMQNAAKEAHRSVGAPMVGGNGVVAGESL